MYLIIIFILFLVVLFFIYSNRIEANKIKTQSITIKSDKIKGIQKFLQLSDLHFYRKMSLVRLNHIKKVITEIIEKEQPDFILLTGDYIDHDNGMDIFAELLPVLKAKQKIFAVLGNHDYYIYNLFHLFDPLFSFLDQKTTDIDRLKKMIENAGIKLLIDSSDRIEINDNILDIIGIDTLTIKKKNAISITENDHYKIVLSHYPDAIRYIKGKVDMVVSGHTHGGQITVFGYPLITRSKIKKSDIKGVSIHKETILLVSKGIGVSRLFPFRFFAQPDINIISLEGNENE